MNTATLPPVAPLDPVKPGPMVGRLAAVSLQEGGTYVPSAVSRFFPTVSVAAINGCLTDLATVDDSARLRRFREWVKAQRASVPTG